MSKKTDELLSNNFIVKGLKTLNTHDGLAYTGQIFIGATKICDVENQGTGGQTNYNFTSKESKQLFDQTVTQIDLRKLFFEGTYNFMGSVEKIDDEIIISEIMENEHASKDFIKNYKSKISRLQKNHIIVGVPFTDELGTYKFKVPLENFIKAGKKDALLESIGRITKDLKKGEQILNTNLKDWKLI